MTGMRQFRGRYSPGCGARISERTLAADLQGEQAEQIAFEGYAPPMMAGSPQAWTRPSRPSQGGQPWRFLQRQFKRLQRLWPS